MYEDWCLNSVSTIGRQHKWTKILMCLPFPSTLLFCAFSWLKITLSRSFAVICKAWLSVYGHARPPCRVLGKKHIQLLRIGLNLLMFCPKCTSSMYKFSLCTVWLIYFTCFPWLSDSQKRRTLYSKGFFFFA
jgi:hypothetical protein